MSSSARDWAWQQRLPALPNGAQATAKLVLLYLAERADANGVCWPSFAAIAQAIGSTPPAVNRALRRLTELGLVVATRRSDALGRRSSSRYELRVEVLHVGTRSEGRIGRLYCDDREILGIRPGETVVVVDDLVTTGGSKLEVIAPLSDAGLAARDVVVLVDREQGGREELAARGLSLHAVLTLSTLLDILVKNGRITDAVRADVRRALGVA